MSTLKSEFSGKSSESAGSYSFIHGHNPCYGNSSYDAQLWLNQHGLEKGPDEDIKLIDGYCYPGSRNDPALCSEHTKHLCSHSKSSGDSCLLGFESATNNNVLLSNAHSADLASCECVPLEQPDKLCSDLDSHWIGVKKIDPWWHAVEIDDLAAPLTSQTSSDHNKSCDHLGVHSMDVEKVSEKCIFCCNKYEEQRMEKVTQSLGKQGLAEPLLQESDRSCRKVGHNATKMDSSYTEAPSGDLSRAQLLEALCHSQTRAREAEKYAQEACDDKDHVINLFFEQASSLFAYRQWLRLLQLETLCLHLLSKDHITCLAPPSLLPWIRSKGVNPNKNRSRAAKKKAGEQRCSICKSAIAFAIGMGLAGAGLLVGWTIGWLFPASFCAK